MKKLKQILALTGAVLLVCMYLATLIFALVDSPAAPGLFKASVAATILIPVPVICIHSDNTSFKRSQR